MMELTMGQLMFYGGITGVVICVLIVIILLTAFGKKRKKELEKIMKSL